MRVFCSNPVHMKIHLLKIFCITIFIFSFSYHLQAQNEAARRIDSVMQIANQRGIFNGNVLVAQKGKIIYQGSFGYADASGTKKLSPDLRFDVGSITKEFNGVGIMILQEQGKLKLDDAVSKYLPSLPAWAQKVKIKHLINYTSGLPNLSGTSDETDHVIMDKLATLKELKFEPGTAYIYCHYNVYLQMRIIEKISGMSYAAFVSKYILGPCKMTHSLIDAPFDGQGIAMAFDNDYQPTAYAQGMSGWVRLPVTDLYLWTQCLQSYRVISKASFRELAVNFPGGESSLGTTSFENDELVWHQHQGSNSNYEAVLYSNVKDDVTVILMTNKQDFKVHGIKSAILSILKNEPFTIPKKSVYLDIREKVLRDFDNGIAYYLDLKANHQDAYDFSFELGDLVNTGKYLLRRDRLDEAIRLFQLAALINGKATDLSYAYELTGEAYLKKGSKPMAAIYYQKASLTDKGNKNAAAILETLQK